MSASREQQTRYPLWPRPAGKPLADEGTHSDRIAELRSALAALDNPGLGASHGNSAGRPARSRNLTQIGANDLGGGGFNADVWALGQYAYVGNWGFWTPDGSFCPNNGTYVVDIKNPANSALVATIPTAAGTQTNDVKVAKVNTSYFRGDLLVVSNEDCAPGGARGFELWGVYVQGDLILGSDMNAGLYILKHTP